jgi:ABC-type nitrate/sulfonate/bicarbonate transport system permease component
VICPIIYENTLVALKGINRDILDEIKCQSNLNVKIFQKALIPMISPYILISLIEGFSFGFKAMIMAEFICQSKNTIGTTIFEMRNYLEISKMYAWILVIIVLTLIEEFITLLCKKKMEEVLK